MRQDFVDCSKGNAYCCKNNQVSLTIDEFKKYAYEAPMVISVKVSSEKEMDYMYSFQDKYVYFELSMLVQPECEFLEENQCSIYEDRPTICRLFPVMIGTKGSIVYDLSFCRSCGTGCVNDKTGFNIFDAKLIEEARNFLQKHNNDLRILNEGVFRDIFEYLKNNHESELSAIIQDAFSAEEKNEQLWIAIFDSYIFPIFVNFLAGLGVNPDYFYKRQIEFFKERGFIR